MRHRFGGRLDALDHLLPRTQVELAGLQAQHLAHDVVETLVVEDQRQLVDVASVGGVDDRPGVDVAEVGDLDLQVVAERLLAAAHDEVGLDAAAAQFGHRVLRRLGLLLARRADERHERDVDVADVVPAGLLAELADRLEEREDLDVADGPADLGDDDVDVVGGDAADAPLDLVGDVRDDLHGLAEVVAATLGGEHGLVDRAGRGVGRPRQVLVDEALVVPEVEVGLPAVVGDEDLAVLERVHRPRVDVDVRVELLQRHTQATELEQPPERRRRQTFAEGAGHPTCHEDVLRHGGPPLFRPNDGISAYRARGRETGIVANQGFSRWLFERNGNAVASILFALAGLPGFGLILGPIAIGLGFIARGQIRATGQPGIGLANAGIAIGVVAFLVPIVGVTRPSEAARGRGGGRPARRRRRTASWPARRPARRRRRWRPSPRSCHRRRP